jgi:hydrogenase-4 component B
MSATLLAASVVTPFLLWIVSCVPRWRGATAFMLPIAPLPALVAAMLVPDGTGMDLPWLMLGGSWALDDARRPLLASMALMWCVGGWFVLESPTIRARLLRIAWPWLFTLTGNMWLAVATDIGGFYSGFAMMSFGAYTLIVWRDDGPARAAGAQYLAYTVFGELALLGGLLAASSAGAGNRLADVPGAVAASPHAVWITLALLTGFGVKAALFGLHGWLRMTYAVAPAAVRVVLGGAMINAGVLGWLLSLPIGLITVEPLGSWLARLGLAAALYGAVRGVSSADASVVLGWSSVSQMGLITMLVGVGLSTGEPSFIGVIAVYAAHHGLAKGALFTGSDQRLFVRAAHRRWLLLPALALAGAPFTSGAAAKLAMKAELGAAGISWPLPWLTAAAIGTTLLMVRVLWCTERMTGDGARWPVAWLLALGATATGVWWLPLDAAPETGAGSAFSLAWPIVAGVVIGAIGWSRYTPRASVTAAWPWRHFETTEPAAADAVRAAKVGTSAVRTGSGHARRERAERADTRLRSVLPVVMGAILLAVVAALWTRAT